MIGRRRASAAGPVETTPPEVRSTIEERLASLEALLGDVRTVKTNPPPRDEREPRLDGDEESEPRLPGRPTTRPSREELTIQTAETLARLRTLEQRLRIGDAS